VHYLTRRAANDIDDIWRYIAAESQRTSVADRLVDAITQRFFILARNKQLGRARDDLRPGLRSFPAGAYIILYRVQNADVLIIRVVHSRRDIISLLPRIH
jgi:toxin ParE1/3/4